MLVFSIGYIRSLLGMTALNMLQLGSKLG